MDGASEEGIIREVSEVQERGSVSRVEVGAACVQHRWGTDNHLNN